jgi:2Fe-2S ferredoxin
MVRIVFISPDGNREQTVEAKVGQTVLEVAHENDIDIEGACEGSMACSTCHVIVHKDDEAKLPLPSEEEADLLDLAYDLAPTSRLGCQIVITEDMDGLRLRLPRTTNNLLLG